MASENIKLEVDREDELENAHEAVLELRSTGKTERRCLKCGGRFLFYDGGSGFRIWCENNDFEESLRGI